MTSTSDDFDHGRLLAEIHAEANRRRESGELPRDFERELDLVFARFAPVDALGDDFEQVLARAEHATYIDVDAPVASTRPAGALVKRVIRKAISWELRYVAQQVSAFSHAVIRALRVVGQRLESLEYAAPGVGSRVWVEARESAAGFEVEHWAPLVTKTLAQSHGRVLHAEAGAGELLERLTDAGKDAYGVDSSEGACLAAADRGLDVRPDDVLAHLRSLSPASLAGLVLSGCVDRLPVGALLDLADLAATRVAPGGVVVVVSAEPRSWARWRSPIEADLAPGRPLNADTWQHLLLARGLEASEVHDGPVGERLEPVGDPAVDINIERLNDVLFSRRSYAVVAARPA